MVRGTLVVADSNIIVDIYLFHSCAYSIDAPHLTFIVVANSRSFAHFGFLRFCSANSKQQSLTHMKMERPFVFVEQPASASLHRPIKSTLQIFAFVVHTCSCSLSRSTSCHDRARFKQTIFLRQTPQMNFVCC